jgi:uncharacterized repeat protein (TIGR03803 family)
MKRLYPHFTALLCAMLCSAVLNAQSTLWGLADGSLFHAGTDGSNFSLAYRHYPDITGTLSQTLLQARDGNVYGLNINSTKSETVFYRISAAGLTQIYRIPYAGSHSELIEGRDGFLYGVITTLGRYNALFFKIRSNGSAFSSFRVAFYGLTPTEGLTAASNGEIYGLSEAGGENGGGFVFKIKSDFTGLEILHHFIRDRGKRPVYKLVEGPDNFLYGVTSSGGLYNYGAIYKISLDGTQYLKLHDFDQKNGSEPAGALIIQGTTCFGMTTKGGTHRKGSIYKINTSGSGFTILHHFNGSVGEFPFGGIRFHDGIFLGLCRQPGNWYLQIFSIRPDGTGLKNVLPLSVYATKLWLVKKTFTPNLTLTSPPDRFDGASVEAIFKSKIVKVALWYRLELSMSPEFPEDQTLVYNSTTREFPVQGLDFSTRYYARLKTSLWPDYGPVQTFITRSSESYAYITRPADSTESVSVFNCRVNVNAVPRATAYHVELSDNPEFEGEVLTMSSTNGVRSFTFPRLEFGTNYFARVKTNHSPNYGTVSIFSTIAEQFPVVTLRDQSPLISPAIVALKVSSVEKASSYSVAISTTPDFSHEKILTPVRAGQNEFILKDLEYSQNYYVRATSNVNSKYGETTTFSTRAEILQKKLVGVTAGGGAYNEGVFFSYHLSDNSFEKHHDYAHDVSEWTTLAGDLVRTPEGYAAATIANATGQGEVITLKPDGTVTRLDLYGPHDGSVMLGSDNFVYVVHDWINGFRGGIYRIHSAGDDIFSLERIIFRFRSDYQGLNPVAPPVELDGYLYGTAPYGGTGKRGTVYKLKIDGTDFNVVHTFEGLDGANPSNSLIVGADGYLYGCTEAGGTGNMGTVFRVRPDGTGYMVIVNFNSSNGSSPQGELLWHEGLVYGTASTGGSFGSGVIFSTTPDGMNFNILHHCNPATGSAPMGGLTANNNVLYGMTSSGGDGFGAIYQLNTNGTGFNPRWNFSGLDGANAIGKLLFVEDEDYEPGAMVANAVAKSADKFDVSVYPNPFTLDTRVEVVSSEPLEVKYIVSDLSGNVLEEKTGENSAGIRLGDGLPRGLYLLKIVSGDRSVIQRLVKR